MAICNLWIISLTLKMSIMDVRWSDHTRTGQGDYVWVYPRHGLNYDPHRFQVDLSRTICRLHMKIFKVLRSKHWSTHVFFLIKIKLTVLENQSL
jgi:hypothetical protein